MTDRHELAKIPKLELHLHLEGAAPPAFIRELAKRRHIDLSGLFDEQGQYRWQGFAGFLAAYEAACAALKTPQDYHDLTLIVLENAASHGVIYTETFLSPDFCGAGDIVAWRDFLAAIEAAAESAQSQSGIVMRAIVTCIRHNGPAQARKIAACAQETAGHFVTGFGMAGDETCFQPCEFSWSFDAAREAGLGLTVHAGEWAGPDAIRAALHDLRVSRIGHGVRAIEDRALVAHLAENGVVLETCPGSNVALGLYPRLRDHPVARLRDAGAKVTVSTDDPPFFRTDMTREYDGLAQSFGWGASDFAEIARTALDAAFTDAPTRAMLQKRLEEACPNQS
ncbi:adenosine deaminase [Roseinatronobacter alkalisoli]|uniref:Adenosine deaminase n=1 Tax=Roseinatronobacter alkalisoli TaxID=3028235 RepID=A0ABT5T3Q3_9RHOB|nr:adenosine deaminase [Roseinatronobacter sp. HJB301]MDD7969745.1 adenosine deaminase [Roseinatronobacter sp. HJB301]